MLNHYADKRPPRCLSSSPKYFVLRPIGLTTTAVVASAPNVVHALPVTSPHRVIQNDRRLLTVPTGPLDPSPPPPPVKWAPKPGPATLRAQALLAARPSPDEVLLARLAQSRGDGPSAPKRKVDTAKAPKRKATAEDASSGKHTKSYQSKGATAAKMFNN
ncbi:hypothetical protein B0H14DRAFT_2591578 [Mycena olivaceomarginata]|nr:hypothetical protein B0H14DRAFT_2591578 [Mycena olivaceomarginata]